jgi:hypothetical protein
MKCSENLTLQLEFQIRSQTFKQKKQNKIHFAEAKTLDGQERHLALQMPISRMAHVRGERETHLQNNIKT